MSKIQFQQYFINSPNRVFLPLKNFFVFFGELFFPEDTEKKNLNYFVYFFFNYEHQMVFFENGQNEANCTIVIEDVFSKWDLAQHGFLHPSLLFLTRCPLV